MFVYLQAPMRVACTMVAAAVCVWLYQEAGSVPVPKTKYWTQLTTPAAKVSSNMHESMCFVQNVHVSV